MISPKKLATYIALLTSVSLTSAFAEVIFSDNFDSEPQIGAAPTKASAIRPKKNERGAVVIIVGAKHNLAGSGNAVYLQDKKSDASINLEYDFVDSYESQVSAFNINFNFAKTGATATKSSDPDKKSNKLYFGAGEYNGENSSRMNSKSRRYLQVEFHDTHEIKINSESGKDRTITVNQNIQNELSIFVNDYDNKAIKYTAPKTGKTMTLEANTFACYMNGHLIHTTSLDIAKTTEAGTVGSSENNFGRMGFYSDTKSDNNGWMFDDFKVTKL